MPTPVIETIAQAIATTLATITSANGYAVTCEVVRPPRRPTHSPTNGTTVLQLDAIENGTPETAVSGIKLNRTSVWTIDHYVEPADDDTAPIDQLYAVAIAEIERALADEYWDDFEGAGAFAGIGHSAELRAPGLMKNPDGTTAGVTVTIAVKYSHTDRDPYTAL